MSFTALGKVYFKTHISIKFNKKSKPGKLFLHYHKNVFVVFFHEVLLAGKFFKVFAVGHQFLYAYAILPVLHNVVFFHLLKITQQPEV